MATGCTAPGCAENPLPSRHKHQLPDLTAAGVTCPNGCLAWHITYGGGGSVVIRCQQSCVSLLIEQAIDAARVNLFGWQKGNPR